MRLDNFHNDIDKFSLYRIAPLVVDPSYANSTTKTDVHLFSDIGDPLVNLISDCTDTFRRIFLSNLLITTVFLVQPLVKPVGLLNINAFAPPELLITVHGNY